MIEILKGILLGAIAGAISAGLGYLKTENPEGQLEKFDKVKFTKTVLLGAILGGLGTIGGLPAISQKIGEMTSIDPTWVETFLLALITRFVEEVTKIIWRQGIKKLLKKLKK